MRTNNKIQLIHYSMLHIYQKYTVWGRCTHYMLSQPQVRKCSQIKLKSLFIFWVLLILHGASQSVLSYGFHHQSPSLLAKKRKKEEPQPPACLIVQIHLKSRLHESFPKIISSSHVLDKVFVCPESSGQMPRRWVGGRDVVTSSLGMKRAFLVELE